MTKIDGVGRLVQVGVRDLGQAERDMIDASRGRIVTFYDPDLAARKEEGVPFSKIADDIVAALPDNVVGEILGGELVVSPRPATPHAQAASDLHGELYGPFRRGTGGPGGWHIVFEPELHLGADILVPDLAGWRTARLPAIPRGPAVTIAPDWVCEIVSPGTQSVDRVRKMAVYARERVPFAWLIDPLARTLEVFRLEGDAWMRIHASEGDAVVRADPFAAVELELAVLWER
jgi:Uma2 family endonuclease